MDWKEDSRDVLVRIQDNLCGILRTGQITFPVIELVSGRGCGGFDFHTIMIRVRAILPCQTAGLIADLPLNAFGNFHMQRISGVFIAAHVIPGMLRPDGSVKIMSHRVILRGGNPVNAGRGHLGKIGNVVSELRIIGNVSLFPCHILHSAVVDGIAVEVVVFDNRRSPVVLNPGLKIRDDVVSDFRSRILVHTDSEFLTPVYGVVIDEGFRFCRFIIAYKDSIMLDALRTGIDEVVPDAGSNTVFACMDTDRLFIVVKPVLHDIRIGIRYLNS